MKLIPIILAVLSLGIASDSAWSKPPADKPAEGKKEDSKHAEKKAELKKRFEARFPKLRELKRQGVIGETAEGYVDFVKGKKDESAADIVEKENADRKELYELIAGETDTTAEKVAERNGQLRATKAAPGEWLKDAKGEWHKKQASG